MASVDVVLNAAVDAVRQSGALEGNALLATVGSVAADGTVSVTRGPDTIPKVRILSGYPAPAVGDLVHLLRGAGGWVCLGALATSTPRWLPLPLASGWSPLAGYNTPSYRAMPDGTVQMSGLASHSGVTTPATVGTLPTEVRPARKCRFAGEIQPSGFGSIDINTNGTVVITDFSGNGVWCPLDVVRYRLI